MSDVRDASLTDQDSPTTKRQVADTDSDDDFFALGTFKRNKKKKTKSRTSSREPGVIQDIHKSKTDKKPSEEVISSTPDLESKAETESSVVSEVMENSSPVRRSKRRKNAAVKDDRVNSIPTEEFDDEEDDDHMYAGILSSINQIRNSQREIDSYQFTEENETDRPYLLEVIPKVEGVQANHFRTKGTKSFDSILKAVIDHYKRIKQIPSATIYSKFSLFWITGKMEIKSFFKPLTLRIPPPPPKELAYVGNDGYTLIRCILIPAENSANAMDLYDELRRPTFDEEVALDVVSDAEHEDVLKEFGIDDAPISGYDLNQGYDDPEIETVDSDGEYFVIGLKGRDNKRLEVKVNAETQLEKLLDFYLSKQNIKKSTINMSKVRLIFDDERLNLKETVGDTELEQDFEVQIFLN